MHWGLIGYAVACVVTPVAWGLLVVWASNGVAHIARRRRPSDSTEAEEPPIAPIDYHI